MAKGPTLKQLAERFKSFDRKKLDETWGAIHRKREQLGNKRFPNSDPRWKAVDRLAKASSAVLSAQKGKLKEMESAAKAGAEKNLQTGERGGSYYVSASGAKVYVK
jgi:hypothetical protein